MAYGFNEDRSKVEVYTQAEIDAMDFADDQALAQEAAARQAGDNVLDARVSNIIADGQQTEGNTELIDIRTGYDGVVHSTAGDAVRKQASMLVNSKKIVGEFLNISNDDFTEGQYVRPNKTWATISAPYGVVCIDVSEVTDIAVSWVETNQYVAGIALSNQNTIGSATIEERFLKPQVAGEFLIVSTEGYDYAFVANSTDGGGTRTLTPPKIIIGSSADQVFRNTNQIALNADNIENISSLKLNVDFTEEAKYLSASGGIVSISGFPGFSYSDPIKISNGAKIKIDCSQLTNWNEAISLYGIFDTPNIEVGSHAVVYGPHLSNEIDGNIIELESTIDGYFVLSRNVNNGGNVREKQPEVSIPSESILSFGTNDSDNDSFAKICIGDIIYAVVGDTLQIFKDSIVIAPDNAIVKISGNKGKNYPRYWEYTPSASDVGSFSINISIFDIYGTLLERKDVTVVVKDAVNPSALKSVLNIGDSTMTAGQIPIEVSRRLKGTPGSTTTPSALALSNFSIDGRKKDGSGNVGWEGTGGWSFSNYISRGERAVRFVVQNAQSLNMGQLIRVSASNATGYYQFQIVEINVTSGSGNIRAVFNGTPWSSTFDSDISASGNILNVNNAAICSYTSFQSEYYQPFWDYDNDQFDILSYVSEYCSTTPSFIFILLGINSLYNASNPWIDFATTINNCKLLIDNIHDQLPSANILLSTVPIPSMTGGIAANYNINNNFAAFAEKGDRLLIMNFNEKLFELASSDEYNNFVKIINSHAQHDPVNGYPSDLKNVNTRSSTQEYVGTNGVHPNNSGYWQIADAEFRALICLTQ